MGRDLVVVLVTAVMVVIILLAWRSAIEHRYLSWRVWQRKDTNRTLETYAAELEVEESFEKRDKDPAP